MAYSRPTVSFILSLCLRWSLFDELENGRGDDLIASVHKASASPIYHICKFMAGRDSLLRTEGLLPWQSWSFLLLLLLLAQLLLVILFMSLL